MLTERGKIKDFVLRILAEAGSQVQRQDSIWVAHLPKRAAEAFAVPERVFFTFNPEHASPNVELLTIGHRLLDQMIHYAQQRGRSCSLIFVGSRWNEVIRQAASSNPWQKGHDPGFRQEDDRSQTDFQRMIEKLRPIRFANARQRIVHRRILYQRQALFRFRVAFCSDEKREVLFPILADPVTETTDIMVDPSKGIAMPLVWRGKSRGDRDVRVDRLANTAFAPLKTLSPREASLQAGEAALYQGNSYVWLRLYRKACEYLEEHIRTEKLRFEKEAESRLAAERKRLDTYYRGMAAETLDPLRRVFRRMASAEVRMGWRGLGDTGEKRLEHLRVEAMRLRNQYEVQLENLEVERERRLEELVEKYRVRTEVSLAQVSLIHVPRIAWNLRLTGPSRREVTILYDVLRERIMEPECDVCERILSSSSLLSCCGDIICQCCGPNCPSCGGQLAGWDDVEKEAEKLSSDKTGSSYVVGG